MRTLNGSGRGATAETKHEGTIIKARRGGRAAVGGNVVWRTGAKARRCLADISPRQPGEYVDPRGRDQLGLDSDDGSVQQPCALRPARGAEQPRYNRTRLGRELVVERRRQSADLQVARGGQMA